MKKEKNITDYVTRTITGNLHKTHLHDFMEKLEATRVTDLMNHSLAMGFNFYNHVKPTQHRSKQIHFLFHTFQGFRFYYDDKIPPNMCEFRDKFGNVIQKFFWSA